MCGMGKTWLEWRSKRSLVEDDAFLRLDGEAGSDVILSSEVRTVPTVQSSSFNFFGDEGIIIDQEYRFLFVLGGPGKGWIGKK